MGPERRESIASYGGDGAHEVRFRTDRGDRTIWLRRDLWFDHGDDGRWIVWAQERSWGDDLPDEDEAALGSIVVTDPDVMAFLGQLGELLVNPANFRNEPEFAVPTSPT